MGLASAPSRPASPSDRTGPGHAHWLRVARRAADDLVKQLMRWAHQRDRLPDTYRAIAGLVSDRTAQA